MINLKINSVGCEKVETWKGERELRLQDTTVYSQVYFFDNQNQILLF